MRATQSIKRKRERKRERGKKSDPDKKEEKEEKNYENHPGKNAQFYLVGNLHGAGGSVPLPR